MDISSFVVAIIIIFIFIVGARELRMKLKSYNIGVRMPWATGPRRKAAQGKEEVSQGTLRHSKWELESEERERESVDIREAFGLVWPVASALNDG